MGLYRARGEIVHRGCVYAVYIRERGRREEGRFDNGGWVMAAPISPVQPPSRSPVPLATSSLSRYFPLRPATLLPPALRSLSYHVKFESLIILERRSGISSFAVKRRHEHTIRAILLRSRRVLIDVACIYLCVSACTFTLSRTSAFF